MSKSSLSRFWSRGRRRRTAWVCTAMTLMECDTTSCSSRASPTRASAAAATASACCSRSSRLLPVRLPHWRCGLARRRIGRQPTAPPGTRGPLRHRSVPGRCLLPIGGRTASGRHRARPEASCCVHRSNTWRSPRPELSTTPFPSALRTKLAAITTTATAVGNWRLTANDAITGKDQCQIHDRRVNPWGRRRPDPHVRCQALGRNQRHEADSNEQVGPFGEPRRSSHGLTLGRLSPARIGLTTDSHALSAASHQ